MDWLAEAQALAAAGEPFALATVVRRLAPASAQPGAKALIRRDGTMRGWVGGSCARPVVIGEAQRALRKGSPRLVRLGQMPGASQSDLDVVEYPMTCHSGGALEILIEPILPAPCLAIVGETPIAETLGNLAGVIGYRVDRVADANQLSSVLQQVNALPFVVVASMGDDEEALLAALRAGAPHVALVASTRRASVIRETLVARGIASAELARLKSPAGLDIGAMTQEEIALSILAEIVQIRAAIASRPEEAPMASSGLDAAPDAEAIDPVCGMTVAIATARHLSEFSGKTWYFCCSGCKAQFEADPPHYAAA
jgi:xanthine dehydrogenase accessory factor